MNIRALNAQYTPVEVDLTSKEKEHLGAVIEILDELIGEIDCFDYTEDRINNDFMENTFFFLQELLEGFRGDIELRKYQF